MEGDTYDVMQNRECIVFERTRDACESRQVHPALFAFAEYAHGCAFSRWNFF